MNSNHNSDTAQSAMRLPIVDDSPEDAILMGLAWGAFRIAARASEDY